jgi:hypothetical protein
MELFYSKENFASVDFGLVLVKAFLEMEILAQVATWAELEEEEELVLSLKSIVQTNNEWVFD